MLTWNNAKFYSKKYFKTNIDLYLCQNSYISLTQPWKPWISYITLPKKTIVYFESVKEKKLKSWFSETPTIFAYGYFPPMTQHSMDLTPLLEEVIKNPDILKIERSHISVPFHYENQSCLI